MAKLTPRQMDRLKELYEKGPVQLPVGAKSHGNAAYYNLEAKEMAEISIEGIVSITPFGQRYYRLMK